MSVRPIVLLGDPRLRLRGEPVTSFGKYLHELLDDLAHTMRAAPGVGLAAPQLGEAVQACVIEVEGRLHELVNPAIVRATGDDRDLEGCLSLPGYYAYVTRRERIQNAAGMFHIAFAPGGKLGIVSQIRPKNLIPLAHVEHGWAVGNSILVFGEEGSLAARYDKTAYGRYLRRLVDEP